MFSFVTCLSCKICPGAPASSPKRAPVVPRTASCAPVPAGEALKMLKDGNARFVSDQRRAPASDAGLRQALAQNGQLPMAAVVGCADSRCPVEIMFDAAPGDLFVLRNAGNTVTHAEGSIVASLEYCIGHLKTKVVVVLGHTKCGAIKGAVASLAQFEAQVRAPAKTVLENYLVDLCPVAQQARQQLAWRASDDEVAERAISVNVFHTMERILEYSAPLREAVSSGEVQMHGAIYDIDTGRVSFLGPSPRQPVLLGSKTQLRMKGAETAAAPDKSTLGA